MEKLKILNLYAGIGGNRKLCQVTAVELNPDIAAIYQDFFPNDNVIVGDAHTYLLEHYKEYDFIWSSPPCTSHSRMNKNFGRVKYIEVNLYQEIVLLSSWFKGKYCVENVIPYYKPLIPAIQRHRHLYWANFPITPTGKSNPPKQMFGLNGTKSKQYKKGQSELTTIKLDKPRYGFDLSEVEINHRKDQLLRNLVNPSEGLYILNCARNIITHSNLEQLSLYE